MPAARASCQSACGRLAGGAGSAMPVHCAPGAKPTVRPIEHGKPSGLLPRSKPASAMRALPSPWRSGAGDSVPKPARHAMPQACRITPIPVKKTSCSGSAASIDSSNAGTNSAPEKLTLTSESRRSARLTGRRCDSALLQNGRGSRPTSKPLLQRVRTRPHLDASRRLARHWHSKP